MNCNTKPKSKLLKVLLIVAGTLSLAAAFAGVILPVLPATPFVMLAAVCYMRSSDRLYCKLKSSRLYQKTMGSMLEKRGMTLKVKAMILVPVWCMLLAMFFSVDSYIMKGVALLLGTVKTIVFFRIKTISNKEWEETSCFKGGKTGAD